MTTIVISSHTLLVAASKGLLGVIPPKSHRLAMLSVNDKHLAMKIRAIEWMGDYFDNHCHESPAAHKCLQLKSMTKKDVWVEYKEDMDKQGLDSLEKNAFNVFWRRSFADVVLRKYLDVPGKCFTCLQMDLVKSTTHRDNRKVLEELQFLEDVHASGIHAFRSHYMNTIKMAKEDTEVQSVNIDGMQSSHCSIPRTANHESKSEFSQNVIGMKDHGTNTINLTSHLSFIKHDANVLIILASTLTHTRH